MRRIIAVVTVAALVGGAPLGADATGPEECEWASFRHDSHNTAAAPSECTDIDVTNVSSLTGRFLYRTRDSVTATPSIGSDGVVYAASWDGLVYAFPEDATGLGDPSLTDAGLPIVEPVAARPVNDANGVSFGRVVGSPALVDVGDDHPLVLVAGGSTLYVWQLTDLDDGGVEFVEDDSLCLDPRTDADAELTGGRCGGSGGDEIEVESSPIVVPHPDGGYWVVVGNSVHNAYDVGRTGMHGLRLTSAENGWTLSVAWKFDPEGEITGSRDGNDGNRTHTFSGATYSAANFDDDEALLTEGAGTGDGCGGVWGTAAVDVTADVVVFGTASCKIDTGARGELSGTLGLPRNGDAGEPDRVAGEKAFAIALSDGSFRWRFDPPRPWGSSTDDDFGTAAQLFDTGEELVAGFAGKDGWYYAVPVEQPPAAEEPAEPSWMSNFGQPGHANNNFAIGGALGSPAIGTAIDPLTGQRVTALFATTAISTPVGTPLDYGTPSSIDESLIVPKGYDDSGDVIGAGRMLSLHAINALDGRVIWRQALTRQSYAHPTFVHSDLGELGGVVFVPSTVGFSIQAVHSDTGLPLWSSPLSGPPSSGVSVGRDRIWLGVGTRQTDAGFKLTGGDSAFNPLYDGLGPLLSALPDEVDPSSDDSTVTEFTGADPQARIAGIVSFGLPAPQ